MKLYTSFEAAKLLGKNRDVVERACKRLGVQKIAGRYIIDTQVISMLKRTIKSVGKPKINKNLSKKA